MNCLRQQSLQLSLDPHRHFLFRPSPGNGSSSCYYSLYYATFIYYSCQIASKSHSYPSFFQAGPCRSPIFLTLAQWSNSQCEKQQRDISLLGSQNQKTEGYNQSSLKRLIRSLAALQRAMSYSSPPHYLSFDIRCKYTSMLPSSSSRKGEKYYFQFYIILQASPRQIMCSDQSPYS